MQDKNQAYRELMLRAKWCLQYKGNVKNQRFIFYEVVFTSLTAGMVMF